MKKLIAILAGLVCGMLVLFCGCGPVDDSGELPDTGNGSNTTDEIKIPERPEDTNLEFWIAEDVTEKGDEWEGHYHYVLSSPESFLESYWGTGYEPVMEENGSIIPPQHYVSYTPKTLYFGSEYKRVISVISITDPTVTVYGLTPNSSFEEFDAVFKAMGYKIETEDSDHVVSSYTSHIAKANGISFILRVNTNFSKRTLQIAIDTSALQNIQW